MSTYQITCIDKPDVHSPHEHITHVGNPAWPQRKMSVMEVIRRIRIGLDTFYVQDRFGNRAVVVVVDGSPLRREHIRTVADGKYTDNLLALNQCSLY
jgi:hypothetical protein